MARTKKFAVSNILRLEAKKYKSRITKHKNSKTIQNNYNTESVRSLNRRCQRNGICCQSFFERKYFEFKLPRRIKCGNFLDP